MNESVILDYLISHNNGTTLYISDETSTELIKEAILRGFQIIHQKLYPTGGCGTSYGGGVTRSGPAGNFHGGWGIGCSPGKGEDSFLIFSHGIKNFYPLGSDEPKEMEIEDSELRFESDYLL